MPRDEEEDFYNDDAYDFVDDDDSDLEAESGSQEESDAPKSASKPKRAAKKPAAKKPLKKKSAKTKSAKTPRTAAAPEDAPPAEPRRPSRSAGAPKLYVEDADSEQEEPDTAATSEVSIDSDNPPSSDPSRRGSARPERGARPQGPGRRPRSGGPEAAPGDSEAGDSEAGDSEAGDSEVAEGADSGRAEAEAKPRRSDGAPRRDNQEYSPRTPGKPSFGGRPPRGRHRNEAPEDPRETPAAETPAAEEAPTPPQAAANYLVHIYEQGAWKRTIDRPFVAEEAELFANEYTRTGKSYGRFAVAGDKDSPPRKELT